MCVFVFLCVCAFVRAFVRVRVCASVCLCAGVSIYGFFHHIHTSDGDQYQERILAQSHTHTYKNSHVQLHTRVIRAKRAPVFVGVNEGKRELSAEVTIISRGGVSVLEIDQILR